MEPQEIKNHLTRLTKAIEKISGENFNCGLFVMSANDPDDSDRNEVTALALGNPKEIATLLIGGLLELSEKEEAFTPVLMATSLTLMNALLHKSGGSIYPFIIAQLQEMKKGVDANVDDIGDIVNNELKKILKNPN